MVAWRACVMCATKSNFEWGVAGNLVVMEASQQRKGFWFKSRVKQEKYVRQWVVNEILDAIALSKALNYSMSTQCGANLHVRRGWDKAKSNFSLQIKWSEYIVLKCACILHQ